MTLPCTITKSRPAACRTTAQRLSYPNNVHYACL